VDIQNLMLSDDHSFFFLIGTHHFHGLDVKTLLTLYS